MFPDVIVLVPNKELCDQVSSGGKREGERGREGGRVSWEESKG